MVSPCLGTPTARGFVWQGGPKWHPRVLVRVGDPPVAPGVLRARGKVLVACGQCGRGASRQAGVSGKASLNRKAREAGP